MYYVYLLQDTDDKVYCGFTTNLKRRLESHKSGSTYTTNRMKNPRLIYYESYLTVQLARQREIKLKQYGSSYMGLLKRLGLK